MTNKNIKKIWTRNEKIRKNKIESLLHPFKNIDFKREFVRIVVDMATNWSFMSSNENATHMFRNIIDSINKPSISNSILVMDLNNVETIESEVILYFIAVLDLLTFNRVNFTGNLPKSGAVKAKLGKYGFQKHVRVNYNFELDLDSISVTHDANVNSEIVGKIVDATKTNYRLCDEKCMIMYSTLIELMDNTYNHAYNEVERQLPIPKNWYVCITNNKDSIDIVFLDIGEGIPSTVRRKFFEMIFGKSDPDLIESTLKGDFKRTRTGDEFRGHGLTETYRSYSVNKLFDGLQVISGKGICIFDDSDRLSCKKFELQNDINGTIFKWRITK